VPHNGRDRVDAVTQALRFLFVLKSWSQLGLFLAVFTSRLQWAFCCSRQCRRLVSPAQEMDSVCGGRFTGKDCGAFVGHGGHVFQSTLQM
jgi:hypothetical protein